MTTKRYSPSKDEVLKALRAAEEYRTKYNGELLYALKAPDTGRVEQEVASLVGLSYTNEVYERNSPIAAGAVRRQLEALKAEGLVLEVRNRGGYGVSPKAKCWATPEAEARRQAAEAEVARQRKERADQIHAIQSRLLAGGFKVDATSGGYHLDVADMEDLLDKAGL
jgi:hypothetical protein